MKRFLLGLTGVIMAASLIACSPTKQNTETRKRPPEEMIQQESTIDGALEKQEMVVDADPTVSVCIYTLSEDKSGLKQNMDAIDGEVLDAQLLIDKMAEFGVIEAGIKVLTFDNKDGSLTLDLSGLSGSSDNKIVTAVVNTFLQNYEAEEIALSVNGEQLGNGSYKFFKEYKKMN